MRTNNELKYHYHPAKGWINDPNGLVFFQGYYHVFYQHQPLYEQPGHAPMVWGHARTKDFLHWEELPVAMEADRPYDKDGVWSGTATVKDGVMYLFYASVSDNKQTISAARSADGLNFEKFECNPLISNYPKDGSADFRDPAFFSEKGVNYLLIASADTVKKTGNVLLYRSDNFCDWEYVGVFCEYEDAKYCECPSFVKCGEGYIMSVSVCPNRAPHYFEVLYGKFDGRRFTKEIVSHFQKGPDEYAGQIFHAPDGRNILISWIPGWEYRPEHCVGCLSLPLEVKMDKSRIIAYPIKEVQGLLDENDILIDAYVTERFIRHGEEVEIKVNLT